MFNAQRTETSPASHSDHLTVRYYQEANGGQKPGGTAEDMKAREAEDRAVLEAAYEDRFGLPPAEALREEDVDLATAAGRAVIWRELAETNLPFLDVYLEGRYHREAA